MSPYGVNRPQWFHVLYLRRYPTGWRWLVKSGSPPQPSLGRSKLLRVLKKKWKCNHYLKNVHNRFTGSIIAYIHIKYTKNAFTKNITSNFRFAAALKIPHARWFNWTLTRGPFNVWIRCLNSSYTKCFNVLRHHHRPNDNVTVGFSNFVVTDGHRRLTTTSTDK